jgi:tight adherence protein C
MIRPVAPTEGGPARPAGAPARQWNPDRALQRLQALPRESLTPAGAAEDSTRAHVTHCLAQALPESPSQAARIRADLARAGDHHPLAYERVAAIRYAGMMASLIVFGTLTIIVPRPVEPWCLSGLAIGMFASWRIPVWRLRRRSASRLDAIERGIPDLVDLVSLCLGQGLDAEASLATAGRELRSIHPALADELTIVCRKAKLASLETALEEFEQRIDLPELRSLVTRLLAAQEKEGALAGSKRD